MDAPRLAPGVPVLRLPLPRLQSRVGGGDATFGQQPRGSADPPGAPPQLANLHRVRLPYSRSMRLRDLAALLGAAPPERAATDTVDGVTHNSAWITRGDVFVAIRGARVDGHSFLEEAAAAGAVAAVGEGLGPGQTSPVPYLKVADARAALADAAAALAGHPSRHMRVVGITGTDGKTTTAWLTKHRLRRAGMATCMLSTVGYELPDGRLRKFPDHFTTPEAPQVQQILADMRTAGAGAAVLETSSHALAMQRVRGVEFDTAVWTNLTAEHLDFHGTIEIGRAS